MAKDIEIKGKSATAAEIAALPKETLGVLYWDETNETWHIGNDKPPSNPVQVVSQTQLTQTVSNASGTRKVQLNTASAVLSEDASGLRSHFHYEALSPASSTATTATAATVTTAHIAIPPPGTVKTFDVTNFTGKLLTIPFSVGVGEFSGVVDSQGDQTDDNVIMPHGDTIRFYVDGDGFVQTTIGVDVATQAELDAVNAVVLSKMPIQGPDLTEASIAMSAGYPTDTVSRNFTATYPIYIDGIKSDSFSNVDINGGYVADTVTGQFIANTLNTSVAGEVTCWFGVLDATITKAVKAKFIKNANGVDINIIEAAFWNSDVLASASWTTAGGEPASKNAQVIAASNAANGYGLESLSVAFRDITGIKAALDLKADLDGSDTFSGELKVAVASAASSGLASFKHVNGTQGIGFGYNTIAANGSNVDQDLNLEAKGGGSVKIGGKLALSQNALQPSQTAIFTAQWGNIYHVDASAGTVTVQVQTAVGNGERTIRIIRLDNTANNVVVMAASGQRFLNLVPTDNATLLNINPRRTIELYSNSINPVVTDTNGIQSASRFWLPSDASTSPVVWYSFRDSSAFTLNALKVATVSNKGTGGTGYNVAQSNDALRPTINSTTNPLYASFDGLNDTMETAAAQNSMMNGGTTATLSMLYSANGAKQAAVIGQPGLTGGQIMFHPRWIDNNTYLDLPITGARLQGNQGTEFANGETNPIIAVGHRNGAAMSLYSSGNQTASLTDSGNTGSSSGTGRVFLGSGDLNTNLLQGRIYEVIFHSIALTADELEREAAYMAWGANLQSLLHTSNTYRLSPPAVVL